MDDRSTRRTFLGLLVVLSAIAGLARIRPIIEVDMYWHLTTAERILEAGARVYPDQVSFTVPGMRYVAVPWLADLFMLLVHRLAGLDGLIIMAALTASACTFLTGLVALRASSGRIYLALAVTSLAAGASNHVFEPRPQAFFIVLVPLGMLSAERFARAESPRETYQSAAVLAVLDVFWAQLHSSFVLLPAMVGLALLGTAQDRGLRAAIQKLWLPPILGLALLTAPGGLENLGFIHRVRTGDATKHIQEMVPLELQDLFPQFLNSILWLDFLLILAPLRSLLRRDLRLEDVGRALLGLVLALSSRRFRVPWALLLVPWAARSSGPPRTHAPWMQLERGVALSAVFLILPVTVQDSTARNPGRGFGFGIDPATSPVDAASALERAGAVGALLNEYEDGGYLTFRLWPKIKISIDGRTPTLFDDELYFVLRRAMSGGAPFAYVDARWTPDFVLIKKRAPLCTELASSPDFRPVYLDKSRALFVRRTATVALGRLERFPPCAPELGFRALCAGGDLEGARAELDQLHDAAPSAWYPSSLAAGLELACGGDGERLRRATDRLLASGTRDPGAYLLASQAFAGIGAGDEARSLADAAVELGGGSQARTHRGRLYLAQGDFEQAVTDLRAVRQQLDDLTPADVRIDLARALLERGERDAAVIELQRALWTDGGQGAREILEQLGVSDWSPRGFDGTERPHPQKAPASSRR